MTRKIDDTLTCLIEMKTRLATEDYEDAKKDMAAALESNPVYAFEWKAQGMVQATTRYIFWTSVTRVLADRGERDAVEYANEMIERGTDSFFGSNSTCNYKNAVERTKATTLNELRRSVREMRKYLPAT